MSLTVSRILHAGYLFQSGETKILFDPIFENPFSRNCFAFPDVTFDLNEIRKLKPDAIFISHFHDDHCSFESLNLLDRKTPIYLYCIHQELFDLVAALGFTSVHALRIDASVFVGAFEIIPRRALDEDVDSIFHIRSGSLNVLNVVDSWIDPSTLAQLAQFAPWDMVLWPFQTMREIEVLSPSRALPAAADLPGEWFEQLGVLQPRYVVPSSCQFRHESWSWYNRALFPISYRQFQEQVMAALPETQVVRLGPSTSVILDDKSLGQGGALDWIIPVGPQDVDYEYDPNLPAPSTSDISKNFAALSVAQTARVVDYCRTGILERYRSLEPFVVYFDTPKLWSLRVYDHTGVVTEYHYEIHANEIAFIEDVDSRGAAGGALSWTTEISAAKLYAALEQGEAMTSLYMRINDVVFEPPLERELKNVDVIDDPLVRCLFNGVFAAYQKNQLRRLFTL